MERLKVIASDEGIDIWLRGHETWLKFKISFDIL